MRIQDARALFPGAQEQIYLDVSLNGLIPIPARDAALRHIETRVMGRAEKSALHARAERVRGRIAALLSATPEEIAITKNVSEGLNLFVWSLPWEPGDNVVFCPELEHPNNVFLWYNLRETRGVEVREIPPEDGRMPVAGMAAAMDQRTRLVTASHITFSPGFISDISALASEARSRDVLTLVDAAQSAGCLDTDVEALGVDALALGTQKSLLSFYGLGFLFIRRELADTLRPIHVARYGMDLGPDAHETAVTSGLLPFHSGARRFELSNYNYLALAAVEESLSLIQAIGMNEVETHVRHLAARLAAGLLEMGLPVAGGPPGPHLAHIVSVGESGGGRHGSTEDPAMQELHNRLTRKGIRLSVRKGILRMSLGLYNSEEDVDRVLSLIQDWGAAGG